MLERPFASGWNLGRCGRSSSGDDADHHSVALSRSRPPSSSPDNVTPGEAYPMLTETTPVGIQRGSLLGREPLSAGVRFAMSRLITVRIVTLVEDREVLAESVR